VTGQWVATTVWILLFVLKDPILVITNLCWFLLHGGCSNFHAWLCDGAQWWAEMELPWCREWPTARTWWDLMTFWAQRGVLLEGLKSFWRACSREEGVWLDRLELDGEERCEWLRSLENRLLLISSAALATRGWLAPKFGTNQVENKHWCCRLVESGRRLDGWFEWSMLGLKHSLSSS